MYTSGLLAIAATISAASAGAIQGFNYGATNPDGSAAQQSDFQNQMSAARKLAGTNGAFTAARLYTMIQSGTSDSITSAIPAAIATKTRLLLGMWASSGDATIESEINALTAAIKQYGSSFTDLVDGVSVGSEDLYRVTATSLMNDPTSVGASPDAVASYISQVKNVMKGTSLSSTPVGHVDTWTAWVNSSNSAVVTASDFIGMDAYPYFQTTMENSISNGKSLFDSALGQTKSFSQGKPVWVTETAWPSEGKTSNDATASTSNAQQYWEAVGCGELFGNVNTYWYTYYDGTPDPSFGLVDSVGGQPRFDLSCSKKATISGTVQATTVASSVASSALSAEASATDIGSPGASKGAPMGPGVTGSPSSGSGSGAGSPSAGSGSGTGNGTATTFAASTAIPPTAGSPSSPGATGASGSSPATGAAAATTVSAISLVAGALVAFAFL